MEVVSFLLTVISFIAKLRSLISFIFGLQVKLNKVRFETVYFLSSINCKKVSIFSC